MMVSALHVPTVGMDANAICLVQRNALGDVLKVTAHVYLAVGTFGEHIVTKPVLFIVVMVVTFTLASVVTDV